MVFRRACQSNRERYFVEAIQRNRAADCLRARFFMAMFRQLCGQARIETTRRSQSLGKTRFARFEFEAQAACWVQEMKVD